MVWRHTVGAVAVVACLGLAACTAQDAGGGDPPVTSGGSSPDGATSGGLDASAGTLPGDVAEALVVEMRQARADWGRRVVQLRVANTGAVDVTVRRAVLHSPTVEDPAPSLRERRVRSGVDRDVSVALGDPACDGPAPDLARVWAELDVVDAEGRQGLVVVHPTDPQGHLARIHGEDCAALALAAGARFTLDESVPATTVDGTLVGSVTLRVEAVPGGPRVEVWQVDRTILLQPPDGSTAWAVAADTAAAAGTTTSTSTSTSTGSAPGAVTEVVLPVVSGRCDPHAVAEDKRGTFFGLHTRVDGVEQPVVYVASSTALRQAVFAFLGDACGWPD